MDQNSVEKDACHSSLGSNLIHRDAYQYKHILIHDWWSVINNWLRFMRKLKQENP